MDITILQFERSTLNIPIDNNIVILLSSKYKCIYHTVKKVLYSRDDHGWWAWSMKISTLAHLQESFTAT